MAKKILVTSALPYANGPLHFGHIAGVYLPADCYTRFQRLQKNNVLHISGSDEYGIAITMSAETEKRSPKEHVDIYHEVNSNFFKKLNIAFDHYSRTTWQGHVANVQQFFLDLLENGYIEERVTDQLYSEEDKKFLADRYVVGTCPRCGFLNARGDECPECGASYEMTDLKNPRSKLTNAPLTHKATKHWFLLLEKFEKKLIDWIDEKDWKANVKNFAKGYIEGLHARAITRDSSWGVPIPLPGTEGKVLYVWFDAPIGYISATQEWAELKGDKNAWKEYWLDSGTKLIQFLGKDNIPFHAAIFPAMVMGQNKAYKLVDELPANEFYKLEGKQFSKSEGWYIDLESFFKKYSVDQIRYAIASNAPETSDSEFTWKDFQVSCNAELLGKYGNLVNRVMVFTKTHGSGEIPSKANVQAVDEEFLIKIKGFVDLAKEAYDCFKVRRASQIVMELAQAANVYFDFKKPWKDAKDPGSKETMEATLACCFEAIKALALISWPIIPESAEKVFRMLGFSESIQAYGWEKIRDMSIKPGQKLGEVTILFSKIEDDQIKQEIEKLHTLSKEAEKAKTPKEYAALKPEVAIEDVMKIDLRVGKILAAEALPKSKKLLRLEVDLGFEKRQVLAGISQFYKPEELVGKKVAVVANLKPAKLMGIESQGMILAGSLDDQLELPSFQNLAPGSSIS